MYNTSSYVMPVDGYYDVVVNGKSMTCAITKDGILLPDFSEDEIEMDIVS
ncbi:MAG: hypothetical protein IJI05_03035 [Erysipelotrichaceae bacterium]|nr:hypothetical protein [Erysipelotrichaceae bacterium]